MTGADCIVIGAGTAGCVAAARLIRRGARVRLLEAGPDDAVRLGALTGPGPGILQFDWGHIAQVGGRTLPLLCGKAVGGTSLFHAGVALRSFRNDYDAWAQVVGTDWSFDAVLSTFRDIENDVDFVRPWHGQSGPVRIERCAPGLNQPIHTAFLEACGECGHSACEDLNAPHAEGASYTPLSRDGLRRLSVRTAFLESVRGDAALSIEPHTTVNRLIVDSGRVTGVAVVDQAGEERIIASDRVILCAGAVGSPALLLRSGIGDPEDLPRPTHPISGVGRRVRDHALIWIEFELGAHHGRLGLPPFQVMLRTCSPPLGDSQFEIFHDFRFGDVPRGMRRGALSCALMSLEGEGRVRLEVDGRPRIMLAFDHPHNVARLARLAAAGTRLLASRAFRTFNLRNIGLRGERSVWREPSRIATGDDLARVAQCLGTAYHLHGGCSMSRPGDPLGVVDSRGAVFGLEGIVVADASVIPVPLRANTHLPTVMIADRIAAWLQ